MNRLKPDILVFISKKLDNRKHAVTSKLRKAAAARCICQFSGRLLIAGTKGYIVASAPWWKTTYFEVHYENASQVDKYSERFFGDGLRYEIRDFLNMINGDDKSVFKLTRGESIAMAEIMEKFLIQESKYRKGPLYLQ